MLDQMADESVCELLEVGLGMLARARLGEGLRNAAQSCVQAVVRACFTRLKSLKKEDVDKLLDAVKESGAEMVVHVETGAASAAKGEEVPSAEQEPLADANAVANNSASVEKGLDGQAGDTSKTSLDNPKASLDITEGKDLSRLLL